MIPAKMLLIYSLPPNSSDYASTIIEYIDSLRNLPFDRSEINTYGIYSFKKINTNYNLILLHYSLFGSFDFLIDKYLYSFLKESVALKIAIFQDEHNAMSKRLDFIKDVNISIIMTLLNESEAKKIYGILKGVLVTHTLLTGYVSEKLKNIARISFLKEDLLFYRARKIVNYGEGALEKYKIGEFFKENYAGALRLDIEFDETKRLYGLNYDNQLKRTKFSLGAEAGTNAIIFEPDCINNSKDYFKFVDENNSSFLGNHKYRMISPRIFENMAYGIVNILFTGSYSNILIPWKHYIPLNKDFSNFNEVKSAMVDDELIMRIIDNSKRDIILSGRFDYTLLNKQIISSYLKNNNNKDISLTNLRFNTLNKYNFYFDIIKTLSILKLKRIIKNLITKVIK
jgi:hypothetical protein